MILSKKNLIKKEQIRNAFTYEHDKFILNQFKQFIHSDHKNEKMM
jgi:hypothetical protein